MFPKSHREEHEAVSSQREPANVAPGRSSRGQEARTGARGPGGWPGHLRGIPAPSSAPEAMRLLLNLPAFLENGH